MQRRKYASSQFKTTMFKTTAPGTAPSRLITRVVPTIHNDSLRRGLGVPDETEFIDDDWLNDARPRVPSSAHLIGYEEVPTVSLLRPQAADEQTLAETAESSVYGPLNALMRDERVSEVTALGPHHIYVERDGRIQQVPTSFADEQQMIGIIEKLLHSAGQKVQTNWPLRDVRLSDGTFLTVVMPPSTANGPALTLRKCARKMPTMRDLVEQGVLNQAMAEFLLACVRARLNIIVCGGVGSGRTTLLNALCTYISEQERIVTIEEVAELQLRQHQVVSLLTYTTEHLKSQQVTIRDLLLHAQHMHPARIIVGECRGNEAGELLQTMYSGFDGIMTTMYAHTLRDGLARFETLCTTPVTQTTRLRTQIAQSLDLIVFLSRTSNGERKVVNIAEVQYTECTEKSNSNPLNIQSIFHYRQARDDAGIALSGKGRFEPSGFCPTFLPKLEAMNGALPQNLFRAPAISTLAKEM